MSDEWVLAIPVAECNEPLVHIGTASPIRFGEPPEYPETAPHYRFLREGVVQRLLQAQAALPPGLYLRLYEGYRSPAVQAKLFEAQFGRTVQQNPSWTRRRCHREAAKLASPVSTFDGAANLPPHSTGGAVDIEIVNEEGKVIDFGMEAKDWATVAPELCATAYSNVAPRVRRNRDLLVEVMQTSGFVNYPREWWHFSYGDKYWALLKGEPKAMYGQVKA